MVGRGFCWVVVTTVSEAHVCAVRVLICVTGESAAWVKHGYCSWEQSCLDEDESSCVGWSCCGCSRGADGGDAVMLQ